jgi:hypothetical protein
MRADDENIEKSTLADLASGSYEEGSPAYDDAQGNKKGGSLKQYLDTKTTANPSGKAVVVHAPEPEPEPEDEEEDDDFASLQVAREKEFMSFIAEPLTVLPDDVAEYIVNEIAVVLRQHVNEALDQYPDDENIDVFDGHLLNILQDSSLKQRLENFRDELLKQVMDSQSGNSSPQ